MTIPTSPIPQPTGVEIVPAEVGKPSCDDGPHWGRPSSLFSYIMKGLTGDEVLPEACEPWHHKNFMVDNIKLNTSVIGDGLINIVGPITSADEVTANGVTLTSRKDFDIPHPTKENHRLRHVCLEGPESAVYVRGRLTDNNVIELPDYWRGLVDPESITVSLTQVGSSQDLIVDKIEWGSKVFIRSGTASNIDCFYTVNATRKDVDPIEVEQDVVEGKSYPEG
jgi:hypothetical protein